METDDNQGDESDGWGDVSIDGVPDRVVAALEDQDLSSAACRVCVKSRLMPNGKYGESWLAIGPVKIAVISMDGGLPELSFSAALDQVSHARIESVSGGGTVVVNVGGRLAEVLRFDAGQSTVFGSVVQRLDAYLNPAPVAAGDESTDDRRNTAEMSPPVLDFQDILTKQRELYCPSCRREYPKNTRICPFCMQRTSTLLRVLGFSTPYRKQIVLMAALMVSGTAISLVPPQITRILVDNIIPSANAAHLLLAVGVLAVVLLGEHSITIFRSRLGVWVGAHVTSRVRAQAYRHLQTLSLSYFSGQQTGALMSRISNDTRQMQGFLVDGIQYTFVNGLTVIGIGAILIWMNPLLGVLVLVPAPVVVLLSAYVWRRIHNRFRLLWNTAAALNSYINDALSGVRVIKAFGQEEAENVRFDGRNDRYCDRMVDAESTWQTLVPILNFIIQTSLLLIWYFGVFEVWKADGSLPATGNDFTVGQLLAYISYLAMIYGPMQLLTRLNDWMTRALTAAARVFEILDTEPEIIDRPGAKSMASIRGHIAIKNVIFGYEKHVPVLKNLSLTIEPGEMIGLVGRSGAGKSTIINLIGRLYEADSGSIEIDGVDIRDIHQADIRRQIGYVLQDTFLFNGTISENIAYAREEAGRVDVIEAAVAANAHEFIMGLSHGYDTVVGERGCKLSGGERQRIAVARAILHNPRILILDEATSSVDTETEAKIQQALANLVRGRTTIAIAHRLSTLRHADRLVVIQEGEIAETGTHQELMQIEDGVFRRLVDIQSEWSLAIAVRG